MTTEEAKKLLYSLHRRAERQNGRPADDSDSEYLMEKFGLIIDEEMGCEYVNGRLYPDQPEIMIHNVNHYRLAKPSRRFELEFGLGTPPNELFYNEDEDVEVPLLIPKAEAQEEESLVTTLDWLQSIEGDYEVKTISLKPTVAHLQTLYSWGIITKKGSIRKKALRQEHHQIPKGLDKTFFVKKEDLY